jgi:hypothetical protein
MEKPGAFILLHAPTALHLPRISEALSTRHPDVPVVIGGDESGALLNFSGLLVLARYFDVPLPPLWDEEFDRAKLHWQEADAVFARHQCHIMISTLGDEVPRLQAARFASAAIGAIIDSHPVCSAVLWDKTVANSAERVSELSRFAFEPCPPSPLWVDTETFEDERSSTAGVITVGLRAFIGRELELEGPVDQLEQVWVTSADIAAYLLQDGIKVADQDIFHSEDGDSFEVRLLESRRFDGVPVIAGTLPAAGRSTMP